MRHVYRYTHEYIFLESIQILNKSRFAADDDVMSTVVDSNVRMQIAYFASLCELHRGSRLFVFLFYFSSVCVSSKPIINRYLHTAFQSNSITQLPDAQTRLRHRLSGKQLTGENNQRNMNL